MTRSNNIIQSKYFEGTSFDSEDNFLLKMRNLGFKYLIYGREICPNTGRNHLQFFFQREQKIRADTVGRRLGCTLFPLRRSVSEAINYIIENPEKPDPDFYEEGPRPSSYRSRAGANRTDHRPSNDRKLETNRELVELARQGRFDTIEEKYPGRYLVSYNVLRKIFYDNIKRPKKDLVRGLYIRGKSGCGKSRWLRSHFEDESCYPYNKIASFFERYNLETTLTIDDLDKDHRWILGHLKIWCNENLALLNVKHGSCWSYFKQVIITSQYKVHDIMGTLQDPELEEAINRRFIRVKVVRRVDETDDLMVVFEGEPEMFPFSLNNYLQEICFTPILN